MIVWAMDVSKQFFSSLAAHVCNMIIAILAAASIQKLQTSACSWYFVVFTIDTTVGVAIAILLHRLIVAAACKLQKDSYIHLQTEVGSKNDWESAMHLRWFNYLASCGYYGNPPSWKPWLWQLAEWTLVTILARALCGSLVLFLGRYGLVQLALLLDEFFEGHPNMLLLFVMVMCPITMNIIQAWIQDAYLKRQSKAKAASRFVDEDHEVIELASDGWSDSELQA